MLQECVQHGTVRRIVTPEGPYYEGSVAVVFAEFESAQKCAKAMHGRFFDGQQIEVGRSVSKRLDYPGCSLAMRCHVVILIC